MSQRPFIHKFRTTRNHYIYDVNTNCIVRTDEVLYRIAEDYGILRPSAILDKWAGKYTAKSVRRALARIREAQESEGIFSSNRPDAMEYPMCQRHHGEHLDKRLGGLILNVTERCNLRCKYCTYSGTYYYERRHSTRDMTWEVAKIGIDYFYAHSRASSRVYISFFGGEPLLNFGLIKRSVDYARRLTDWPPVIFHVDTNGTSLTRETMKFLIANDVILQVSLDGPSQIHNRYRVFENGMGSFYLVAKNLERLRDMDRDYYETRVTFAATLAPPYDLLETYRFYSSSDLVTANNLSVSFLNPYDTHFFSTFSDQVKRVLLSEHLTILRSRYFDLRIASSSQSVDQFLRALFEPPLVRIHRRVMGRMGPRCPPNGICVPGVRRLFVDVEGRLYPCERVGQAFCIGHVSTGIERARVDHLLKTYIDNSGEGCTRCWAARLCRLCLTSARKADGFDFARKENHCLDERSSLHQGLVLYSEIMERNPKAFDFVQRMLFE